MKTIPTNETLTVPSDIAVCPYCQAALSAHFDSWEQQDDGTWATDNAMLSCVRESDSIAELQRHCVMPYVYWLPVSEKVLAWVNANYRFEIDKAQP